MKKIHLVIIVILIVLLGCIGLAKLNLIDMVIEKRKSIEIAFYVVVAIAISFLTISNFQKKMKVSEFRRKNKIKQESEEFNKIYNILKKNLENKFENLKKRLFINGACLVFCSIFFVVLLIMSGSVSLTFSGEDIGWIQILTVLFGIGSIYFVYDAIKKYKEYYNMYKHGIIGNMVKLMNNNLEYVIKNEEMEEILRKQYVNAEFEHEKIDTFIAEDFVSGNMMKDSYIFLSDIYVKKEKDEQSQEVAKIIFNGLFATTTINKNINSLIKILTEKLKFVEEKDFIKMDSSELEKYFDIYSEDQMLAVRILTPEIIEMLVNYFKDYGILFEIIIKNNFVYFRFFTENMFETRLIENPFNKKKLFLYYNSLRLILDLTEKFNENLNSLEL